MAFRPWWNMLGGNNAEIMWSTYNIVLMKTEGKLYSLRPHKFLPFKLPVNREGTRHCGDEGMSSNIKSMLANYFRWKKNDAVVKWRMTSWPLRILRGGWTCLQMCTELRVTYVWLVNIAWSAWWRLSKCVFVPVQLHELKPVGASYSVHGQLSKLNPEHD